MVTAASFDGPVTRVMLQGFQNPYSPINGRKFLCPEHITNTGMKGCQKRYSKPEDVQRHLHSDHKTVYNNTYTLPNSSHFDYSHVVVETTSPGGIVRIRSAEEYCRQVLKQEFSNPNPAPGLAPQALAPPQAPPQVTPFSLPAPVAAVPATPTTYAAPVPAAMPVSNYPPLPGDPTIPAIATSSWVPSPAVPLPDLRPFEEAGEEIGRMILRLRASHGISNEVLLAAVGLGLARAGIEE